jgi:hypothetical protein
MKKRLFEDDDDDNNSFGESEGETLAEMEAEDSSKDLMNQPDSSRRSDAQAGPRL